MKRSPTSEVDAMTAQIVQVVMPITPAAVRSWTNAIATPMTAPPAVPTLIGNFILARLEPACPRTLRPSLVARFFVVGADTPRQTHSVLLVVRCSQIVKNSCNLNPSYMGQVILSSSDLTG